MSVSLSKLISGFSLSVIGIVFGYLISDVKPTKRNLITSSIIVIVYSILYGVIYDKFDNSIRSIINFAINTLIFKFVFDFKFTKAIFVSFLHSIILLISDILSFAIPIYVLQISKNYFDQNIAGGAMGSVIVCTIFCILAFILRKPLRKLMQFKVSYNKVVSLYMILTIICIGIFFFTIINSIMNGIENNLLINIFSIIAFLIIMFSLINQKVKNEKITREYDNLIEFVREYETIIEEQRISQHENKNILVNIKSKIIDKSKIKDIIEYIDSVLDEKVGFDKIKYAKLGYLPSNGLKGLFYYKINKAESNEIKVNINISKSVEKSILYKLNTRTYKDLCKIIGVYLDNAIEASQISDKKILGIEVYNHKNHASIIISNSYSGDLNESKFSNRGYSTKGAGRRYGLSLVKSIIKNNDMFQNESRVTPDLYIQKLIIKEENLSSNI